MVVACVLHGFIGLGGCSYVSRFPGDELPDRSGSILSGRMNREAVRASLGEPFVASRYWGVDLYRHASSQTEVPIAVVIPYARLKDDIYRYTLVAYGGGEVAQSTATGLHRKPSKWRTASPIEYDHLTVSLRAGDLTFVTEWEDRYETLLATPARRDAYLALARSSSQCTVVIGCGTRECSQKLRVDDGPTLPLPCRLKVRNFDAGAMALLRQGRQEEYEKAYPLTTYETVAALSLAPGSHTLKAWGGRWQQGKRAGLLSGEASTTFSCRAGEILYLVIDVSAKEYGWWGAKGVAWKIQAHERMPEIFLDRPLLLYRGDRWLVDPEPREERHDKSVR